MKKAPPFSDLAIPPALTTDLFHIWCLRVIFLSLVPETESASELILEGIFLSINFIDKFSSWLNEGCYYVHCIQRFASKFHIYILKYIF
jgi:hypothetical protein